MNPTLTIEFGCLEEMAAITLSIRNFYREAAKDPDAMGCSEFVERCHRMAEQMDCIGSEVRAYLSGQLVEIEPRHC